MVEVDEQSLRRAKIYMMYSIYNGKREIYFFTYRARLTTNQINAIIYGKICQTGSIGNVVSSFWKSEGLLSLSSGHRSNIIYELEFGEFAQHVVAETI